MRGCIARKAGEAWPAMKIFRMVGMLLLLAVSLQAQPVFVQPKGWMLGTEFPAKPNKEEEEKRTKTPKGDMVENQVAYEKDGEVFGFQRTRYPLQIPKDRLAAAYDGGKRGMLRARPGNILSEETITISGYEARRYIVDSNEGTRLRDHRVVIIGDEVYQFVYERFKDAKDSPTAKAFFEKIRKRDE